MKKQLITATIMMALGTPSWAKTEDAPVVPTDTARSSSQKGSKDPIQKSDFVDNEGRKGHLVLLEDGDKTMAIFTPEGCSGDLKCKSQTLIDKKITEPFSDLEVAIRKSITEKRTGDKPERAKRTSRRDRSDDNSVSDYRKTIEEDLESLLEIECALDSDDLRSAARRRDRDSQDLLAQQRLSTALNGTRWASLALPQTDEKASCAGQVISEFMDEKDEEFHDMEFDEDSIKDLHEEIRDLKGDLRYADSENEKKRIQAEIDERTREYNQLKKEADARKKMLNSADGVVKKYVDNYLVKAAAQDIASGNGLGINYLHNLASETPDTFKGVRSSASKALLEVYKLQAQSQLALKDAASRTTDPALRMQFESAATGFASSGLNYNLNMNNPATRSTLYNNAFNRYLNSYSSNPERASFDDVQKAQAYANSVVNEIYSAYSPGANEISGYLTGIAGNSSGTVAGRTVNPQVGGINLPQILADGSWSVQNSGTPGLAVGVGRAQRTGVQNITTQGGLQPGRTGQTGTVVRGQRPTVLPPK